MADSEDQLRRMVMTFRVSELQMLLGYAGKNKTGRKNELQSRAIEIVRLRNPAIQAKIKELYKSIQYDCPQSLPVSEKKDDKTYHNAFDVLMKNAHEKQLPPKRSLR
ncbi:E3 SUMO-protein ligase PIAS1-like [Procambarus clarkii]|uniref:E3 SUMO-protein ligase PIAS1-like n=1 Tax=Procambarus clarkii TaxID=6728 RepID=UPI003742B068